MTTCSAFRVENAQLDRVAARRRRAAFPAGTRARLCPATPLSRPVHAVFDQIGHDTRFGQRRCIAQVGKIVFGNFA